MTGSDSPNHRDLAEVSVLATAMEPYGGMERNVSEEALLQVDAHRVRGCLHRTVLPVAYGRVTASLTAALERYRPDIVVCFGQAEGSREIAIEKVAVNIDDTSVPDNDAVTRVEKVIDHGAPISYWTGLPKLALRDALSSHGFPVQISDSAGGFVCNHLFFRLMQHLDSTSSSSMGGFVHMPTPLDAAGRDEHVNRLAEAIVVVLNVCIDEYLRTASLSRSALPAPHRVTGTSVAEPLT